MRFNLPLNDNYELINVIDLNRKVENLDYQITEKRLENNQKRIKRAIENSKDA